MALGVLCVLVHENSWIPKKDKSLFYLTYAVLAASLFAEWLGIQLSGNPDIPTWLLSLVKCLDYILTPVAGGAVVAQMKLRNNCLFPETSCIDVSGDVISAREQGECVVSYTSSQDVEPCFARPVLPQALKPVTFNVTLGSLWYGKIAGACAAGTGTVDDPYLIKNGDQLAYAIKNNKADEFYEQICDIMLSKDFGSTLISINYNKGPF